MEGVVGGTDGRRQGLYKKEENVRIDSAAVAMESTRSYASVTGKSVSASKVRRAGGPNESLESLFGDLINAGGNTEQAEQSEESDGDIENAEYDASLEDITAHFRNVSNPGRITAGRTPEDVLYTIRQRCIQFLMELLFSFRGQPFETGMWDTQSVNPGSGMGSGKTVYQAGILTNRYYHMEQENTTFSTTGTVKTADGRELSFNLDLTMSRRFEEYYEETYATERLTYCDPLVINLDTNIAEVSDQKFFFDLDQDGEEEEISTLKSGSGYLALDLNGDGKVNDGGELFGTKSGNGFADLAEYDSDGNGWIDEADDIWNKLLIWVKDDTGKDVLYHLSDLGVGAIGLGNVSTEFALNSAQDNHNNAMVRNTGIFLYENGNVSTVQHLDLAR